MLIQIDIDSAKHVIHPGENTCDMFSLNICTILRIFQNLSVTVGFDAIGANERCRKIVSNLFCDIQWLNQFGGKEPSRSGDDADQ